MKISDIYRSIKINLDDAGIDTAELDARWILEHRADVEWSDLISNGDQRLDEKIVALVEDDVERRIAGEPLSRIYGVRQFWGLDFKVTEHTLDPRPDTETLIEAVLSYYKDKGGAPAHILDLGTGTGCILITLLKAFPEAKGVAVDKSVDALRVCENNARAHDVENRTRFIEGSWFDSVEGAFDLIVSNPPYISNQVIPKLSDAVKNHDPILSLDGGKDGLDAYRDIFSGLCSHLKPCGKVFLEIGYDQFEDVVRLSEESRFFDTQLHLDLAGQPRVVEISSGDK